MSDTFKWCVNKTRLAIYDKQVFFVYRNGSRCWVLNGKFHRVNGPAVEYAGGGGCWYLNGKLHRLNGPAAEFSNGMKYWYLNGVYYKESVYWKELNK